MTGYLMLLRPKNALMSSIGAIIGFMTGTSSDPIRCIITAVVPPLVLMGGNAVNDYFDYEIDAINKPYRPIPQGIISRREAFVSYILLSVSGVVSAFFLGPILFIIAFSFALAWYFYAKTLKAKGLIGNIVVSTGVAFTIIFGYISASGGSFLLPTTLSLIAFSSNLAREIVKTVEDLPGDRRAGLSTVPIRFGMGATKNLTKGLIALTCLLAFIPYILRLMGVLYLIFSIASVSILVYVFTKMDDLSPETARNFSKFLKLAMALGLNGMLLDLIILR